LLSRNDRPQESREPVHPERREEADYAFG
jgi:hypothetical protein